MSSPQPAPTPAVVECEAASGITPFVHNLGGPVDVIGITAEGETIGVIANPITDDEVEVVDPTGTAVRLRATPAAEEEQETP